MTLNELIDVLIEARDKRGLGKTKVAFHGGAYGNPYGEVYVVLRHAEHGEKFVDIEGDDASRYIEFVYESEQDEQLWP